MRKGARSHTLAITANILRWTGLAIILLQSLYLVMAFLSGDCSFDKISYINITLILTIVLLIANLVGVIKQPGSQAGVGVIMMLYYLSVSLLPYKSQDVVYYGSISTIWLALLIVTVMIYDVKYFLIGSAIMLVSSITRLVVLNFISPESIALTTCLFLLSMTIAYCIYRLRKMGAIQRQNYNRLKLRERLQSRRLKVVVNNLKDGLISVDSNNRVRLYNAAALDLIDTNKDLIDSDIDQILTLSVESGESIKASDIVQSSRRATERDDIVMTYPGGQRINLHLSILPIRDQFDVTTKRSHIDGFILIMRDITKEKSLDEEKDEFISVVSHELRTPVAIAEGALSNLQFLVDKGASVDTFSPTLDAAHKQILYLGSMVNDLSTLSRAQRGVYMDNEDIDIDTFMNSLENKYAKEADQRKLKLIVHNQIDGAIFVPSMALEEIMQNLITNALKYTKEGSVIVGARRSSQNEHKVVFYVKDSGIGISKSDQAHVFQRFWRSEDYRTRETSGTGLGLHIVDQLAHKIGTQINLTSRLNVGSTFSFELPLKQSSRH